MNRPNKQEYEELLSRYLEGKCSKEEKEALDRWYDSFDQEDTNDIDGTETADLLQMKGEMFKHISEAIDQQELQNKEFAYAGKNDARVFRLTRLMHLAAVLVAGIVIGMAIFSQHFFGAARQATSMNSQREAEGPLRVEGPATIYLSDGSVVWLDSRSWLEHPRTFTGEMRAVILSGEAFFAVAKDSARPFVIHSTNFTTRVLGTSFKIKDHEHEEFHEVEVVSGKVMVSVKDTTTNSIKNLILKSNRKAVYSKKDNSFVESRLQNEAVQALSSNLKLEFNEVALADIVKVLNVVHGAHITIANQGMNRCIITADLTNETLDVSIAILSKALNADVSVRGKEIILSGPSCTAQE